MSDARPIVLEGLGPVRQRPGMYIGAVGVSGLENMLLELVGNSIDQHIAGAATRLSVTIDKRGWVTVEDDGRGIPVDAPPMQGHSVFELIFTTLHSSPSFDGHEEHVHVRAGSSGAGIGPVNALCERLELTTCRKGIEFKAAFEQGRLVEPLAQVGTTPHQGTVIRYRPDPSIFDADVRHDLRAIRRRLVELAGLCPNLALSFQGKSLQRIEGLNGWVRKLAPDIVKETALFASGSHQDVRVEASFAWRASGKRARILSFVNCSKTRLAGSHADGLMEAVGEVPPKIAKERVLEGLVGIVHVYMLHPRFQGPMKWTLHSDEARVAVREVVSGAIDRAPWWWDRLHEAIG